MDNDDEGTAEDDLSGLAAAVTAKAQRQSPRSRTPPAHSGVSPLLLILAALIAGGIPTAYMAHSRAYDARTRRLTEARDLCKSVFDHARYGNFSYYSAAAKAFEAGDIQKMKEYLEQLAQDYRHREESDAALADHLGRNYPPHPTDETVEAWRAEIEADIRSRSESTRPSTQPTRQPLPRPADDRSSNIFGDPPSSMSKSRRAGG